jgi:arylsulfatase A-like enzyme
MNFFDWPVYYSIINSMKSNTKHLHRNVSKFSTEAFFLLALVLVIITPLSAKPRLKNIILITVDTLRADHLSAYGYPLPTSPNIDRLMADSIRFAHCFSLTPLTTPSFSTVLTSLPPYKHGAKRNGLSIYRNIKTFPYYLQRYGYITGAVISNWPLRKKLSHFHRDFNWYSHVFTKRRYLGVFNSEGSADAVNKKALPWLEKNQNNKFFLWVHFTEPHAPYVKHKGFTFNYIDIKQGTYPKGTRMKKIARYDSEIAFTDNRVGRIIKKLKELGLYESSLIVFLSDHGESFGEHNYFKHGRRLYNSTAHVPLSIKLPGNRRKGEVNIQPVTLMDVAPTIFAALNMKRLEGMQGLDLLAPEESLTKRLIMLETYGGTVHFRRKNQKYHLKIKPIRYALIKGNIKVIFNYRKKSFESYNWLDDPYESKRLTRSNHMDWGQLASQLQQKTRDVLQYIKLHKHFHLKGNSLSQKDFDALKSLGYIE